MVIDHCCTLTRGVESNSISSPLSNRKPPDTVDGMLLPAVEGASAIEKLS